MMHSTEPRDAKTMTLGTDLSVRTSHSCQILIFLMSDAYDLGYVSFTHCLLYLGSVAEQLASVLTG